MTEQEDMREIAKLLATLYASSGEEVPLTFAFDNKAIYILGSGEMIEVKARRLHKKPIFYPLIIEQVEAMPV